MDEATKPQTALELAGTILEFARSVCSDSDLIDSALGIARDANWADRRTAAAVK